MPVFQCQCCWWYLAVVDLDQSRPIESYSCSSDISLSWRVCLLSMGITCWFIWPTSIEIEHESIRTESLLRCGEPSLLEPWLFTAHSNLGQNGRKCGAGDTLDPSFGWFLVRAGTSHVAFLVACALGGVAAMPSRKTIVGWCRCGRDVIALWEEGERYVARRPNISHHSSNENALKY